MRRIYESNALVRDDESPYQPNESDARVEPRAMRTVPGKTLSRLLVPHWIRAHAIRISVSSDVTTCPVGATIPFTVTMKNVMPFPITIPTNSPLPWNWYVDGHPEASHVTESLPNEGIEYTFDRGERKRFTRKWNGMFRTGPRYWTPATPGEYTISARLDVESAAEKGLRDETTVRLVEGD